MIEKRKPYKNKKITRSANGEECTANFPGCNYDSTTSVFCHLNEQFAGKGMSQKADDCAGFIGCSHCHDLYDQRRKIDEYKDNIDALDWERNKYWYLMRAYYRTMRRLIDKGVIK